MIKMTNLGASPKFAARVVNLWGATPAPLTHMFHNSGWQIQTVVSDNHPQLRDALACVLYNSKQLIYVERPKTFCFIRYSDNSEPSLTTHFHELGHFFDKPNSTRPAHSRSADFTACISSDIESFRSTDSSVIQNYFGDFSGNPYSRANTNYQADDLPSELFADLFSAVALEGDSDISFIMPRTKRFVSRVARSALCL